MLDIADEQFPMLVALVAGKMIALVPLKATQRGNYSDGGFIVHYAVALADDHA